MVLYKLPRLNCASDKFESKGIKASAARARKALSELAKLTKVRRAEIQEKKNAM